MLQRQIVSKSLEHIYVFTGIEHAIMNIYIDKMAEALNTSAVSLETANDAYKLCVRPRLMATSSQRLFVVRDDKKYLEDDKLWAIMQIAAEIQNDVIIFVFTSLDKRTKLYKSGNVVEFAPLSSEILVKYIQKDIALTDTMAKQLVELCENDYSRILLEIDKINQYAKAKVLPVNKAMEQLVAQNAIYEPVGDITFKLTDAILTRDFIRTNKYLALAKRKAEPEILLLSVLYNGFRQILLVQGCGSDSSNLTGRTGLTAYQVKLALDKKNFYSIEELVNAMKLTREVEVGVKRGTIDADMAIEYLIIHVMPYA